jgi:transcriptional regulator with XRE-family HTH domain
MLSQRLRQLRKAKSLTLQQVADQLGVTRASVSKWETGLSHPDFRRLDALAGLYGVTPPELLGAQPPQAPPSRDYPVVVLDYASPIETLIRQHKLRRPSWRALSERAFFVALQGYMSAYFGLNGVERDALLLIEPALVASDGDLVLAFSDELGYQVLAVREGGGQTEYVSLGIKLVARGPLPGVQPIGLVLEATSTRSMRGFALSQRTFTLA